MIKLIASDLDGTLLQNGAQSITETALDLIKKLSARGIIFVAASGRQYPNLYRLFQDASKDMAFIAENGALVIYREKQIYKSVMERDLAMSIIKDIYQTQDCEVLISGWDTSYLKPKTEEYYHRMKNIVKNNVTVINDFEEIKEEILKVSVYDKQGIASSAEYFERQWSSKVKSTVSGLQWLDFVNPHVNKGVSLQALIQALNIAPSEVMAFGDNYNDLEMLSLAGYGYVMENAVDDIKSRYSYRCKSVEEILNTLYLNPSLFQ